MTDERRPPEGNVPCTFQKYVYKIKDKTQLKKGQNYFVIKKEYENNGCSLINKYDEKNDINDNFAKTKWLPQEDKKYLNSQYGTILKYDEDYVKRKEYFFYELNSDYRKKSLLGKLPNNLLSDFLRTENENEDVTYIYDVDPIFESHNIYSNIKPRSTPIVPRSTQIVPRSTQIVPRSTQIVPPANLPRGGRKNKKSIKYKTQKYHRKQRKTKKIKKT